MNKKRVKNGLGFFLLFILCFLFLGAKAQALPPDVDSLFKEANKDFDTVMVIHQRQIGPGDSEIEKIEDKLYYLGLGLKHQKEAKEGAFECLEAKIDTLLLGVPYTGLPADVQESFDSANYYFDMVDTVHNLIGELPDSVNDAFMAANEAFYQIPVIHEDQFLPETTKIEMKLNFITFGLINQKHAKQWSFYDLEAKLDTLLGRQFKGLHPEAQFAFEWADTLFDSVFTVDPALPPPLRIEKKLYYLALALHWQKWAKWIMFYELEWKLNDLLDQDSLEDPEVTFLFEYADLYFDSVTIVDTLQQFPEEYKIEWKIHLLTKALAYQKEGMRLMFWHLEQKADQYSGRPFYGLPEEADYLFYLADSFFAEVDSIHKYPGPDPWFDIELKLLNLAYGLTMEKEAKWYMFTELKRKLFEFDKVELKLHYLGKALEFQKHAKRRMFEELEIKLDDLLGQDYPGHLPPPVEEYFDLANDYFDLVDSVHQSLDTTELARIEAKLYFMNNGLIWQKEGMRIMFDSLEFKFDLLLDWPYHGLPDTVIACFDSADSYLDLVNFTHLEPDPALTELEKVELKLYYLSQGLKYEKDAKWIMFDTLEYKIDSLYTDVEEIGEKETVPDKFILLQNYPNPFNPKTNIEFILKEQSWVTVEIYNLLGQRIKVVADRKFGPGSHSIYWDGKDEKGKEVSSGIYFYRVKTKDSVKTKKMVLVK